MEQEQVDLKQYNSDIKQLEIEISQLLEMSHDLNKLTSIQSEQLDMIDNQLSHTRDLILEGEQSLIKAEEIKTDTTMRTMQIVSALTISGSVILLCVGAPKIIISLPIICAAGYVTKKFWNK